MTFEQAFVKIKSKFVNADVSKLSNDFAIQVNMTDEDCGGAFYIQFIDNKLLVEPYDYHDNTCDVTLKKLDLYKILDKKLDVDKALENAKIYLNGNKEDLKQVIACIDVPAKKETSKKSSTKKKPVKDSTTKTAPLVKDTKKPAIKKVSTKK